MNLDIKNNINFALKIIIPIIIVIGLFLGGVSAGIITFESPNKMVNNREISAGILIDFGDGIIYSNNFKLDNSTVFDFLLKIENIGHISIETTYWESFGGYSIDTITYQGVKYEADFNTYWALYINGQAAMEGADKIYVKNDDLIEWKFEKF
jgi:hypothetical protein